MNAAFLVYILLGSATAIFGWWWCPIDSPDEEQPGVFILTVVIVTWPYWILLWLKNTEENRS